MKIQKTSIEFELLSINPDEEWPEMGTVEFQLQARSQSGTIVFTDVVTCDVAHALAFLLGFQVYGTHEFSISGGEITPRLRLSSHLSAIDSDVYAQTNVGNKNDQLRVLLYILPRNSASPLEVFELDGSQFLKHCRSLVLLIVKGDSPLHNVPQNHAPIHVESVETCTSARIKGFSFAAKNELTILAEFVKQSGSLARAWTFPLEVWFGLRSSIALCLKARSSMSYQVVLNDQIRYTINQTATLLSSETDLVIISPYWRGSDHSKLKISMYQFDESQLYPAEMLINVKMFMQFLSQIEKVIENVSLLDHYVTDASA